MATYTSANRYHSSLRTSFPSSSPPSSRLTTDEWDPQTILNVDPSDPGFTCVGFAPSQGRRCHNPIAAHNRSFARKIFYVLGKLSPMAANVDNLLDSLAPRVLCQRNHQGQAYSMVATWQAKVDALADMLERERAEEESQLQLERVEQEARFEHVRATNRARRERVRAANEARRQRERAENEARRERERVEEEVRLERERAENEVRPEEAAPSEVARTETRTVTYRSSSSQAVSPLSVLAHQPRFS